MWAQILAGIRPFDYVFRIGDDAFPVILKNVAMERSSRIDLPLWALVPAAGSGSRMGSAIPKQYMPLQGRPVIVHALETLCAHPRIQGVQVMLAKGDDGWFQVPPSLGARAHKLLPPAVGGASRTESVLNGLRHLARVAGAEDWVLVHDAARPCLRRTDLDALIEALREEREGAILGVPVADTLKQVADGRIADTASRAGLWRAFTPQAFRLGALEAALVRALQDGVAITDEASAMERVGGRPRMVCGHSDNIKVTVAEDLLLAEHILVAMRGEGACG